MASDAPRVSIILPLSCGHEQALGCLQSIAAQPANPTFEVIVVDDASVGLEPLLAQLDGDVKIVSSPGRVGFAAAIGLALGHVQADSVAIVRDAAIPDQGWLPALLAGLSDPGVGISFSVTGQDPATPALRSWAAALATEHLRTLGVPAVDDELVLGTLALSVASQGMRAHVSEASSVAPPRRAAAWAGAQPGAAPELTIVIPTLDATSPRMRRCLETIAAATEAPHEVVVVDNGAPAQGFSDPVNAGVRAARTPYVVVMNDDVEVQPGWWSPLRATIDAGAVVAFPWTIEGAMRTDFAAWCFAISRDGVDEFGHAPDQFFDPSLVIWFQDTDLLHRLRQAGRPPVLVRESRIRHGLSITVGTRDPILSAWVRRQITEDQARFVAKHPDAVLQTEATSHA
jgi:GT2 family glycosyltransferase